MDLHIGVDIDGVLRALLPSIRREYVRIYPDREKYLKKGIDSWGIRNMSTDEKIGKHLQDVSLNNPFFSFRCFANADPIPGQISQLRDLYNRAQKSGDSVSLCTSQDQPWKRAATLTWVSRHDVPHDDLIMTATGKGHFGLDFHFDDRVKHCEDVEQSGLHGVLKMREYNEGFPIQADSVKDYADFIYEHFTR